MSGDLTSGFGDSARGPADPRIRGAELRNRTSRGVTLLTLRGGAVLLLGMFANIALARMLVPRDFGLVGLGSVFVVFGGQLAYGGVGLALIRRETAPTWRELQAVNAAQLAGTAALAVAVAGVGAAIGRDGLVVATMAASLPIAMLRAPAIIVLERQLRYREISVVDVVEAVAFYAWSLSAVALGMGVWGLATGMVVRAIVGTATMARIAPLGILRPRWSWPLVRPLIAFGLKFQALSLASVAREQGLNAALAAIWGVAMLGIWTLAWRILQVPVQLLGNVGRVAYPAVSRLLDSGEDPRSALERGVATLAVATGVLASAVAGFAPALPELTGDDWLGVPPALLWASVALVVGPPIAVIAIGYLMAAGELDVVVRSTLVSGAVWFAVTLPLVGEIEAAAVGIGWIAAAVVNAGWIAHHVRVRTSGRLVRCTALPAALAIVAIFAGWAVSRAAGSSIVAGVAGAAVAELVLLAGLAAFQRRLLRESYELLASPLLAALRAHAAANRAG